MTLALVGMYFSGDPLLRSLVSPDLPPLHPDTGRWLLLTMLAMLIVKNLAHELRDRGVVPPGTLDSNLSEFRELVLYYAVLLYVLDVVRRRCGAVSRGGDPVVTDRPAQAPGEHLSTGQ